MQLEPIPGWRKLSAKLLGGDAQACINASGFATAAPCIGCRPKPEKEGSMSYHENVRTTVSGRRHRCAVATSPPWRR